MKLHNTVVKKYALATLLMGAGFSSFAQVDPTKAEKPVTIDSFDVVRDYKPILADAVKIRRSPDMTNKREYQPKLSYGNIIDRKLDINTGLKQLNVQQMPFTKAEDIKSNYVKLGVGNFNTILGEAYFAAEKNENMRYGAFLKHISQKGSLENQQYGRQEFGVFGRRTYDKFTIDGTLGYNRNNTRFYGVVTDINGASLNPAMEKQVFNDIYFTGELTSNFDEKDQDALSYSVKADAYTFKDRFNAKENSFAFSGFLNKRVRTFNVGVNASVDINAVEDVRKTANHIALVNPYVKFKGDNYDVQIGANIASEFGDSTRFNIFPTVAVDFAVVPTYAHIFAGVTGNVKKGSLRDFANQNQYLNSDINIQNTVERIHIYGGVKGNAGATFGYKVQAFYKKIDGLPLFMNAANPLSTGGYVPYKFDVVYDGLINNAKHLGFEGALNVRISNAFSIGGKVNIDDYTLSDNEEAWHLPKFRLAANTRINISEKLFIDGELTFQGQTYSLAYDFADATTVLDPAVKRTVPSFVDLSAGAEYRATKQLGIFVRANNMFGKEYERYLYYPRLGFNVLGGINFSF
ncbi:TonB-dependent receptor [Sphingobacteriaceae bacterium WQ 2009]|uniref:TonB-dependent receptor n=1 Tax=Rhinopithecimicrobium faecis TaxID=2820698 RepID=A0A8T4H9X3_9SPHI|nr:TonB-dependent receptor [Sphingobacteriaceae bacterium WQ 2009]